MVGLRSINIGDKVKPASIEKYKGAKGVKDVISVLSRQIDVAHTHYFDGLGYIYCFEGSCCTQGGLAMIRYIVPIVQYTGTHGSFGEPVFVKYLSLAREAYEEDLLVKDEIKKDITKFDILVSCSDEKYQKLKYETLEGAAKWQTDDSIKAILRQEIVHYKRLIGMSVARSVDEAAFQQFLEKSDVAVMGAVQQPAVAPQVTAGAVQTQLASGGNNNNLPADEVKEEKKEEKEEENATPENFKFDDLLGE